MAPREIPRTEWTRNKSGGWTRSLGERGMRVRLFENRRGGVFYRQVWVPGVGRSVQSLRTKDRAEAERLGRQLLAALLQGEFGEGDHVRVDAVDGAITLGLTEPAGQTGGEVPAEIG